MASVSLPYSLRFLREYGCRSDWRSESMIRPLFKRFGDRPRFPAAFWLLVTCLAASLLFMLFQGGKMASMLFIMMTFLTVYLLSGNWSGIRRAQGTRKLTNTGLEAKLEAGQSLQIQI